MVNVNCQYGTTIKSNQFDTRIRRAKRYRFGLNVDTKIARIFAKECWKFASLFVHKRKLFHRSTALQSSNVDLMCRSFDLESISKCFFNSDSIFLCRWRCAYVNVCLCVHMCSIGRNVVRKSSLSPRALFTLLTEAIIILYFIPVIMTIWFPRVFQNHILIDGVPPNRQIDCHQFMNRFGWNIIPDVLWRTPIRLFVFDNEFAASRLPLSTIS